MARASKTPAKATNEDATAIDKPVEDPVVEIVKTAESDPVDDGIARLKAQLEAEKEARKADQQAIAESQRQAFEAARTAHQAKMGEDAANLGMVTSAIETCKGNADTYEQTYAQAMANQDFAAAAKVQRAMAANEARLLQLENGKQAMEEAAKRAPAFRPPRQADPVEAFASQLTPRSAAWVRSHPEYARNKNLTNKMIAAHQLAVADGIDADTDEYFAHVEDTLKIGNRAARILAEDDEGSDEPLTTASQGRTRQSSPPAAPVTRNISTSGVNSNPRAIRLTADQAEMARMSMMTELEYWEQLQRARGNNEITH